MFKKLQGPLNQVVITRQLVLLILLAALVLAQAIGVIYTKQNKRVLHGKLQAGSNLRDKLQVEWGRLLLEEGTWQADARVEKIARDNLGMLTPNKINVVVP